MDPILYWNEVALEANRVSHTNEKNEQTSPTLSSRALAIVHKDGNPLGGVPLGINIAEDIYQAGSWKKPKKPMPSS